MIDKVMPGPIHGSPCLKEAVCIHTRKIYDSCRLKECMQDLRVYMTRCSQEILDRAVSVKARSVELLWVYIDVEPVAFNKGFYNLEARFFYRVTADAYTGVGRPYEITGVTSYSKRIILYGGEGGARIFSSTYVPGAADVQNPEKGNMPQATVEVVAPILLASSVTDPSCSCVCNNNGCGCTCDSDCGEPPAEVCGCFNDELILDCDGKRLYVTIGQFGIIRLERDSQLLIPSYDFCLPQKDCSCVDGGVSGSEDPCTVFAGLNFPTAEFFPGAENCGCNG
ncbi:MAG: hypothetical protein IKM07_00115 [Clostridia bacterium]|nr:hypothetical protein [Clostridia bacterium]